MNSYVRNALALVAGLAAAWCVNMGLIMTSGFVVAPPQGADMFTAEGIRAAMPRMSPVHYLMPFLAHALGTLVGGFAAAAIAAGHKMKIALAIGVVFLLLGVVMISLVGGPLWFIAVDVGLAFVPMAWLGGKMAMAMTGGPRPGRAAALGH